MPLAAEAASPQRPLPGATVNAFERRVRTHVIRTLFDTGAAPSNDDTAHALDSTPDAARAALHASARPEGAHTHMSSASRTIVICGATGKQGGAVLDSLSRDGGWHLVALTRDVNGPAAHAIRQRGVEVRYADLVDADSLTKAFAGAYGVYGVTTMVTPKGKLDTAMERRQGRAIADACVASGVQHLVLSTIPFFGDRPPMVPYIRSKLDVEAFVVERGVPHTFLGPGSFMDEIGGEFLPVKNGVVTGQAADDVKVPYVACRDIGEFARFAFADPAAFMGRKLTLIGDFISGEELAQVLTRVTGGRPHRHKAPPIWLMWIFAREWISLRKQFEAWGRAPHPQDLLDAVAECRRLRPEMLSFERYLEESGFGKATS